MSAAPAKLTGETIIELRAWYLDAVGYDPMVDCPTMTETELRQLVDECRAEIAKGGVL